MANTVKLVNQRPSILDLSSVSDVHGAKVVLKPKGQPGASREVPAEAEQHPDVQAFINIKWVAVERLGVAQPAATKLPAMSVPRKTVNLPTPPAVEDSPAPALPDLPEASASVEETAPPEVATNADAPPDTAIDSPESPATPEAAEVQLEAEDAAPEDAAQEEGGRKRKRKNR